MRLSPKVAVLAIACKAPSSPCAYFSHFCRLGQTLNPEGARWGVAESAGLGWVRSLTAYTETHPIYVPDDRSPDMSPAEVGIGFKCEQRGDEVGEKGGAMSAHESQVCLLVTNTGTHLIYVTDTCYWLVQSLMHALP